MFSSIIALLLSSKLMTFLSLLLQLMCVFAGGRNESDNDQEMTLSRAMTMKKTKTTTMALAMTMASTAGLVGCNKGS